MLPSGAALRRVLLVASIALGTGCDGGAGEVREWRPNDHDNNQKRGQVDGGDQDATIAVAYKQLCARCHGPTGRGDGPDGRMMRVPDLTRPAVQSGATDEQIAEVIRNGRNKMPPFGTLPPDVVSGLVRLVRELGGRGPSR